MGTPSTRVALVDSANHGLPTYTVPAPPAGPVTEMWHIQNPLNEHAPMLEGIQDMHQWGQVVVTMNKYAGRTFEQLLDGCRTGNYEIGQCSGWIIGK